MRYPHAKDFLEYIKYRKLVHFKKLDNPKVLTGFLHQQLDMCIHHIACQVLSNVSQVAMTEWWSFAAKSLLLQVHHSGCRTQSL